MLAYLFQSSAGDVAGCELASWGSPCGPSGFNPQPATSPAARPTAPKLSRDARTVFQSSAGDVAGCEAPYVREGRAPRHVSVLSRRRRRLRGGDLGPKVRGGVELDPQPATSPAARSTERSGGAARRVSIPQPATSPAARLCRPSRTRWAIRLSFNPQPATSPAASAVCRSARRRRKSLFQSSAGDVAGCESALPLAAAVESSFQSSAGDVAGCIDSERHRARRRRKLVSILSRRRRRLRASLEIGGDRKVSILSRRRRRLRVGRRVRRRSTPPQRRVSILSRRRRRLRWAGV